MRNKPLILVVGLLFVIAGAYMLRSLLYALTGLSIFATSSIAGGVPKDLPDTIYGFKMKSIEGKTMDFAKFKGKVLVVVNVASKCGNTPQYKGLEQLYEKHKADGLLVLGFPANNFGGQEPGSEAEISEFCTKNYGVKFPMFSKISVKGDDIAPLYQWLLASTDDHNDVDWNFAKFVVEKDGKTVHRFKARTQPDDEEFLKTVEQALEKKG